MASSVEFRRTLEQFIEYWNRRERDQWLACLSEEVRHEEPAGAPVRFGHAPFAEMFDFVSANRDETHLEIKAIMPSGNEAAMYFVATSMTAGVRNVTEVIEIWTIDDRGKLSGVRAFVDPKALENTRADPTVVA